MNETMIKKMEELLTNEEFAQKFTEAGSYENVHKLFVENGVDVSYDDFMVYIEDCRKVMVEKGLISEDGELGPELLEAVSGGKNWGGFAVTVLGFSAAATGYLVTGHPIKAGVCIIGGMVGGAAVLG